MNKQTNSPCSSRVSPFSGVHLADASNVDNDNSTWASFATGGGDTEFLDAKLFVSGIQVDSLSPDPSNPNFTIGIIQSEYQSEGVFEWWSASESGPSLTPAQVNDPTFQIEISIDVDGEELQFLLGEFGFSIPNQSTIVSISVSFRWAWFDDGQSRISEASAEVTFE